RGTARQPGGEGTEAGQARPHDVPGVDCRPVSPRRSPARVDEMSADREGQPRILCSSRASNVGETRQLVSGSLTTRWKQAKSEDVLALGVGTSESKRLSFGQFRREAVRPGGERTLSQDPKGDLKL